MSRAYLLGARDSLVMLVLILSLYAVATEIDRCRDLDRTTCRPFGLTYSYVHRTCVAPAR